ncbi:MAG: 3-deoxy-D-manno-octulosonic acid transferase [Paucibacter sp.]|nr:3-deoxy-D-manno-octulosonic acid transferase [Roseateles sp.]
MKEALARVFYSALLRLVTPLYLLRLWRRGAKEPAYRQSLGERLGFYRNAPGQGWVWVHAVSLGETLAAAALVDELRTRQPGLRLLLTCSTATGREAGRDLLRERDVQCWLPFDTPGAVQRFFRHWQPAVGVLMETEIWPNLLHFAPCPMVLANARLSERSARRGRRFAALLYPAARRIRLALAQTEADAQRMRATGAPDVRVMGNLKYELAVDEAVLARGRAWRQRLGRPVLLLAVSREGEETMLLQAWAKVATRGKPLLLIVPRHPQRFDEVAELVHAAGLKLARRSSWGTEPNPESLMADAWLGDSMREMPLYYGMSDVALLGGSFAPLGGQNLIQAAACGCPLVMGPHTFNFAEASRLAEEAGAAQRVTDMDEGLSAGLELCQTPVRQAKKAAAAQAFAAAHRGAAARMAQAVAVFLPQP